LKVIDEKIGVEMAVSGCGANQKVCAYLDNSFSKIN